MTRLVYRHATEPDLGFCVETFLDSYRDSHAAGLVPMDVWHEVMRPVWTRILSRPGVAIHVAAWAGEDDGVADLAGWIAVERGYEVSRSVQRFGKRCRRLVVAKQPLVLYVFVKQLYRESGIARGLFAAAGVDPAAPFRHATKTAVMSDPKLAAKIPHAKWAPLIVRYPKRSPDVEAAE